MRIRKEWVRRTIVTRAKWIKIYKYIYFSSTLKGYTRQRHWYLSIAKQYIYIYIGRWMRSIEHLITRWWFWLWFIPSLIFSVRNASELDSEGTFRGQSQPSVIFFVWLKRSYCHLNQSNLIYREEEDDKRWDNII